MGFHPPSGGGGGAPTDATYITQTANGSLSAEQAMGALATGIVKNTTTTGVQSIAVAGTDYVAPGGALGTPSSGVATNLTGTAAGLTAGNVTTNANLTGDVTSVGNATTIAAKAVDVAMLADGTDGELITWGADAVATTVAAGTSGQVLTSNGAGAAPTFQDAAGGGASLFDATVGSSGADYTDIQAAITGVGGTDIKLMLITDVTEDSNIAVPAGASLYIHTNGFALIMGTNQFTYTAAADVELDGFGWGSGSELDWSLATGDAALFDNGTYPTSVTRIKNLTIDSNGSTNDVRISNAIEHVENVKVELPDVRGHSFYAQVDGCTYRNMWLVGGGTNSRRGLRTLAHATIDGVYITGTWDTSLGVIDVLTDSSLSNITYNGSGACQILATFGDGWTASNIIDISGQAVQIDTDDSTKFTLTNFNLGDAGILRVDDSKDAVISNGYFKTLETTAAGHNIQFSNLRAVDTAAATIAGDRYKFTNCEFLGGASVSSGADNNGFVNCQFGADAGAGAGTLTIVSGANNARIVACMTDAAISDSGTGTVTSANVVY